MTDVCIGCGLAVDVDGNLVAAGAAVWGDSALPYTSPDTNGDPVYCDSAGVLRTVPKHYHLAVGNASCTQPALTIPIGTGEVLFGFGTDMATISNPSPERVMAVQELTATNIDLTFNTVGLYHFFIAYYSNYSINGVPAGDVATCTEDVEVYIAVAGEKRQFTCAPNGDNHDVAVGGSFGVRSDVGVNLLSAPGPPSGLVMTNYCMSHRLNGQTY